MWDSFPCTNKLQPKHAFSFLSFSVLMVCCNWNDWSSALSCIFKTAFVTASGDPTLFACTQWVGFFSLPLLPGFCFGLGFVGFLVSLGAHLCSQRP